MFLYCHVFIESMHFIETMCHLILESWLISNRMPYTDTRNKLNLQYKHAHLFAIIKYLFYTWF